MEPRDPVGRRKGLEIPGPPFFIIGSPRSGTTMLFLILDNHSDIAVPPESHFIPRLWARRRRYGSAGRIERADRFLADLAADRQFRHWGLPIEAVGERLSGTRSPTIAQGIRSAFEAYARTQGKVRWGDKTPQYVVHVALISKLFPEARFVHLIRDGRDVALSVLSLKRLHRRAATAAFMWARDVGRGRSDGSLLARDRYYELHYEDFVQQPVEELRQLCLFLGVRFDESMLRDHARSLDKIPDSAKWMHSKEYLPPTSGLRDWRRDMAPSEVAEWEAIGGRQLAASGYQRSTARSGLMTRGAAWGAVAWFFIRSLPARHGLRLRKPPDRVNGHGRAGELLSAEETGRSLLRKSRRG